MAAMLWTLPMNAPWPPPTKPMRRLRVSGALTPMMLAPKDEPPRHRGHREENREGNRGQGKTREKGPSWQGVHGLPLGDDHPADHRQHYVRLLDAVFLGKYVAGEHHEVRQLSHLNR